MLRSSAPGPAPGARGSREASSPSWCSGTPPAPPWGISFTVGSSPRGPSPARLAGVRLAGVRLAGVRFAGVRFAGVRFAGVRFAGAREAADQSPGVAPRAGGRRAM
ncbi:pentapeptide repeat-containing protein [Kitasatospora sp. NPDC092039]|uniref:pentapeptide repeat-containing protein n=1 Tax=Kitasatospora sp. NPDC092039 TaxID=3364086 RepID=UPI0037FF88E8